MKQRLPISHFEKISRLITPVILNFFSTEQDFSTVSLRLSKKPTLEILHFLEKKLTTTINRLDGLDNIDEKSSEAIDNLSYVAGLSNASPKDLSGIEFVLSKLFEVTHKFNAANKKIFKVEEQLTHELILTDCDNVSTEFLNLPYPTILIHIPFNKDLFIYKDQLIEWIYVTEEEISYGNKRIQIFCVSRQDSYFTTGFTFTLGDVGEQIKKNIIEKYRTSNLADFELTKILSFITAFMLYVNSKEKDESIVNPIVMFKKVDGSIPMCSLGGNIKIDRRLYEPESNENHESKTIHVVKWTVRGHYRTYWTGSGRTNKEVKWIRPHLKGRERNNPNIDVKPTEYTV